MGFWLLSLRAIIEKVTAGEGSGVEGLPHSAAGSDVPFLPWSFPEAQQVDPLQKLALGLLRRVPQECCEHLPKQPAGTHQTYLRPYIHAARWNNCGPISLFYPR